jgi:23S rRNA (adenine2503-C2)-methyltransferase
MPSSLQSITPESLKQQLEAWHVPVYRADQILRWVYRKQANSTEEMSNVPKSLRDRLQEGFACFLPECVQKQGGEASTQKFLWRFHDGAMVESVLIPASPALYGEASDRHTLCVSTQVGCAYGCRFCASGLDGWKRNLEPEEIVGQLLATERYFRLADGDAQVRKVNNLVIMGMGEPMANYENLMQALRIINAPWGCGIGARKITISTSGLAPRIEDLAREPFQFRLAISLHGATDAVRTQIMPVNQKYPIQVLMDACQTYIRKKGKMITFEYILIEGVNDGLEQVEPLADWSRRMHAKVNLIPYNTVAGLPWKRPEEPVQEAFLEQLLAQGVKATLRREKGHDIDAACGQLRLRVEKNLP